MPEGSSPRVRGRREGQIPLPVHVGLIPAGAGQTVFERDPLGVPQAHPRGCGADEREVGCACCSEGSSPRVRGRRTELATRGQRPGLIPAGAGQTHSTASSVTACRAHPRGCGADLQLLQDVTADRGSSPRVRGRLARSRPSQCQCGLIPAGAGQTGRGSGTSGRRWAHPRGCGADRKKGSRPRFARGSSPRVRGRRCWTCRRSVVSRLIPAGAGQTHRGPPFVLWGGAHPRGCGADRATSRAITARVGSSPRVRGRLPDGVLHLEEPGLIPAGAGQTRGSFTGNLARRAHPRGCGADQRVDVGECRSEGSSPRVRGRPTSGQTTGPRSRLIPAGAGQTTSSACPNRCARAHPRGCGADDVYATREELDTGLIPAGAGQTMAARAAPAPTRAHPRGCGADRTLALPPPSSWGSSPRVRGRRRAVLQRRRAPRLIPAGAGQTCYQAGFLMRGWAHPRGCGADRSTRPIIGPDSGSSPRVRGRQVLASPQAASLGLIPAGAGQTFFGFLFLVLFGGSSPRVRGRHRQHHRRGGRPGLIPAGAGQTAYLPTAPRDQRGSSPRVRGRHRSRRCRRERGGLIPAGAGQTSASQA